MFDAFLSLKSLAYFGQLVSAVPFAGSFQMLLVWRKAVSKSSIPIIAWKHKSIPFSQILKFLPPFAKDRRYFWGFVLWSSVSVPASNLQCSQNAETLWHGDNFLSNRQCCQQCRFVILTVGYNLGLDVLGGWRLLAAVGSGVCVWQSVHLLSCCACFFSSCRQLLTLHARWCRRIYTEQRFEIRYRVWG